MQKTKPFVFGSVQQRSAFGQQQQQFMQQQFMQQQFMQQHSLPRLPDDDDEFAEFANFTPSLYEAFRKRISPVLNCIDALRSHGLQHELPLPTVAVVGDQSVGKSSVLEAISGVELPRGSGIVTRCPLQLAMRFREEGQWKAEISYMDKSGKQVRQSLTDRKQVGDAVRKAQEAITEGAGRVSEGQIDLSVQSSDVPDLTLIDLPGIARVSQEDPHINKRTKDLIRSYITQSHVIILAVVPCHVDIDTVEAIAMARQVDPSGLRTLGVMTCPDLSNPGSELEVMKVAQNEKVKLNKGFVMVKCRSPEQLTGNVSLGSVVEIEKEFFENHKYFSKLPEQCWGIGTLSNRLTEELFSAVASGLHNMATKINEKLHEYDAELNDLRQSSCDSESEKRMCLLRMCSEFTSDIVAASSGKVGDNSELYGKCMQSCRDFGKKLNGAKPDWVVDNSKQVPPDITHQLTRLRGRELPSFTYIFPCVEKFVQNKFLPSVHRIADELIQSVNNAVGLEFERIVVRHFKAFPSLCNGMVAASSVAVEDAREQAEQAVKNLLLQERRVFVQDELYARIHDRMETRLKEARSPRSQQPVVAGTKAAPTAAFTFGSPVHQSAPDLSIILSDSDRIRLGCRAFLQVAAERISGTVPMAVMHFLLDASASKLDSVAKAACTPNSEGLSSIGEDPKRSRRRLQLEGAVKELQAAKDELLKVKRSVVSQR